MSRIAGSVVGLSLLVFPGIAVAQYPSAQLTVGWLGYSAGTISQELSVQTNWLPITTVRIRCQFVHFFKNYSKQVGASAVEIKNIAANAVAYGKLLVASPISPTSANCRIVSVTY